MNENKKEKNKEIAWHALSVQEVLHKLQSSPAGLTEQQAKERQVKFGPNALPKAKTKPWYYILLKQFNSLLFYVLSAAAIVSLLFADWLDFGVILVVIFMSVLIGFFEEYKAENILFKLLQIIQPTAKVKRGGQNQQILASELVPGDILELAAGEKVAVDARLLEVNNLAIEEAILTGEAEPQPKSIKILPANTLLADRQNMVYLGTAITAGTAKAVVVVTGQQTEMGKIAKLLHQTPDQATPLAKKLNQFSRFLTLVLVSISILVFVVGLIRGFSWLEMFATAIAVMVASIPEVILVIVTIILALGMQRILKQNGLVRNLLAAETLGATTVICTDKTGTLTAGQMQVTKVAIATPEADGKILIEVNDLAKIVPGRLLLEASILNNDSYIINPNQPPAEQKIAGASTERALLELALKNKLAILTIRKDIPRIAEIPFDANLGWMITAHQQKGELLFYLKGKPEKVLAACQEFYLGDKVMAITPDQRQQIKNIFSSLAAEGLRILAFAYQTKPSKNFSLTTRDFPDDHYIFLGVVGIKDALREEVLPTINEINQAGIKLIILTGDHSMVAQHIARDLGLIIRPEEILDGDKLNKMPAEEFSAKVSQYKIYARVTPPDKLKIVRAWQAQGQVVAMTGDGVNDAPALKAADIGVALGSGTEVAKEASDLVLLDNSFTTIVTAIKEGRVIFNNIKKTFIYLLIGSFNLLAVILASLFFGWPLPLVAAQILWINLITDGLPDLALAYEPATTEIMKKRPRLPMQSILNKKEKVFILLASLFLALIGLLVFGISYQLTTDLAKARTLLFATLALNSIFLVLTLRSLNQPFWRLPLFSNKFLIWSLIYGLTLQLLAIYLPFFQKIFKTVPLLAGELLILLLVCLLSLMMVELFKAVLKPSAIR